MASRPRWHKVVADFWGNKVRSLLVIASISVGLFAVGLITNMYIMISEDMQVGYQSINPANIQVNASSFGQELIDHIRNMDGVRQAEGARAIILRFFTSDGEWKPIEIKAIPDIADMDINQVHLEQGVWPPQDREIVVDYHKLADMPAGLGGNIQVELPSGKIRNIPLVGVIHDQTIGSTEGGGFFLAPAQGYITLDTLDWLGIPATMNRMYITVEGDRNDLSNLREVARRVTDEMENTGAMVYSSAVRASDDHPNRVYVQAISAVLFVLGFLVMFLSAFLITTTLSALLNQQIHQIGIMKTIGARRGQIVGIYMLLIFIFGVIAFGIALPLSSRASYAMLSTFASQINMVLQGYRVIPFVVLLQLIIALVVPQAAGFIPIINGTRISAIEALSGYNQSHPPKPGGWMDRRIKNVHRISRPLLLSLRNTFRRRGRLLLTLLTLTLGGAIFIATFNVQRSLTNYIERIGKYFLADVNLTMKNNYRISEIQNLLQGIPGIGKVEGWAGSAGVLVMADGSTGESFSIIGPPANSQLVDPVLIRGRWIQEGDENVLTVNERFREVFPDLKPGDILRVKIEGKETDMEVVGFFRLAGKSSGFLAYTAYDTLSKLIHEVNKANTYRITGVQPGLTLEEQEELGRKIEIELESRGYAVGEVTAGQSLTASTADGLNILTGFLLMMASLIAIVGSIGLMGTMSMNVLERTREIGIVRAIGASDRSVISLVLVEGMLIGLMSWGFGTLLAFPISSLMSNAINLALFGAAADFTFTPLGVLLWLLVVMVLSVLASVLPARNAARLTIREVLAYE